MQQILEKAKETPLNSEEIREILEFVKENATNSQFFEENSQRFVEFFREIAETRENPDRTARNQEETRAFLLFFGSFLENPAFSLEDKPKLEVFSAISSKIRAYSLEIAEFLEIFLYFSLQMAFIRRYYAELQDFHEIHRKIKQKMHEDGRFYVKFLENCQEIARKHVFSCEIDEIQRVFLGNLREIARKSPHLLRNHAKSLISWFSKQLSSGESLAKRLKKVIS